MRSFLGLTNYYQWFMSHFVELATPLSDAIKEGLKGTIILNSTMNEAFMKI